MCLVSPPPPGIIRLPKATKNPPKNRVIPRQSLATIVKDLGKPG